MRQLRTAAATGDAGAQFNLGVMLSGMPDREHREKGQNRAEAIFWLLKSALQGLPRAHGKLAEVYASAPTAPGDAVRACIWFRVAASSMTGIHQHRARVEYRRIAGQLPPEQLDKANRDARAIIEALHEPAALTV